MTESYSHSGLLVSLGQTALLPGTSAWDLAGDLSPQELHPSGERRVVLAPSPAFGSASVRSGADRARHVTTILILHRFSTVRHADRICVLEHGRVDINQTGCRPPPADGGTLRPPLLP